MLTFAVDACQCKNDKDLRARAKEIMAKYQAEKKVRMKRKYVYILHQCNSSKERKEHCC